MYIHQKPKSFLAKLIEVIFTLTGRRKRLEQAVKMKKFLDQAPPIPPAVKSVFSVSEREFLGRKAWYLDTKEKVSSKVLVYLHGGAYINNLLSFHWDLIGAIGRETGAKMVVADYPLAPKASVDEVYAYMEELYGDLLEQYRAEELIFIGDSAGGGLALGFAQQLVGKGSPLPSQLILLSPWLDVTMSDPDVGEIQPRDKMLGIDGLVLCGKAYAKEVDPRDPRVSPIFGSMDNLPKISVFIGTNDLLLVDAKRLCRLLEKEGREFDYFEYPGMFHVWMAVTQLPESRSVVQQVGDLVRA